MNPRISPIELHQFCTEILQRCGLGPAEATKATDVIVYADQHGFTTHGLNALVGIYAPRLLDGRIAAGAQPAVIVDAPALAVLDAGGGLGLLAMTTATDLAVTRARSQGIGLVAVRNSSHFGSAGFYSHRAAEQGMIAIAMSNCGAQGVVPPLGGTVRMLGTNPLSAAAPAPGGAPFVLDMSATTVATGKVRAGQREGRQVPAGWLVDADGHTTTDPDAYFAGDAEITWLGGRLETGAAKGYGLAILVDLLCGPLAGASFGPTPDLLEDASERPDTDIGHVIIAVDPTVADPAGSYPGRARTLLDTLVACPPSDQTGAVTYPGRPEAALAQEATRTGIALPRPVAVAAAALAGELGLRVPPALLDGVAETAVAR